MKKLYMILPIVLLAACQGTQKSVGTKTLYADAALVQLESLLRSEHIPLYPDSADSPSSEVTLNLLSVPSAEEGLQKSIKDSLYDGDDIHIYADKFVASWTKEYRDAYTDEDSDSGESSNWYYTETVERISGLKSVLQLSRQRESYTGGAHSTQEKQYFVFDNQKRLSITDIVQDKPALTAAVEVHLRSDNGLAPNTPLSEAGFFEDSAKAPDNFYLSPEGITFHWNPYEIAPYVRGPIETTVPYSEIALTALGKTVSRQ